MLGFHPTKESNLRTALGVEICKLSIIARICKLLSGKFSDLCREMGRVFVVTGCERFTNIKGL